MDRKGYTVIYVVLFAFATAQAVVEFTGLVDSAYWPAFALIMVLSVVKAVGVAAYYQHLRGTTGRHVPRARRDCCCARADRRGGVLDTVRVSGPDKLETDRDENENARDSRGRRPLASGDVPVASPRDTPQTAGSHRGPPHRPRRPQAPLSTGSRRGRR